MHAGHIIRRHLKAASTPLLCFKLDITISVKGLVENCDNTVFQASTKTEPKTAPDACRVWML